MNNDIKSKKRNTMLCEASRVAICEVVVNEALPLPLALAWCFGGKNAREAQTRHRGDS